MKRRNFLGLTTAAGTAAMLSSLQAFSFPYKPPFNKNKKFELKIMATNWGFDGSMDAFCAKAKKDGYDGVELPWPGDDKKAQDEMFAALKNHQLDVGFLCRGWQKDPHEHLDYFKRMIDAAAKQSIHRPLYINCHSGRDYFSFVQNKSFIDHTTRLASETGITICHETHRSRIMFAAHITKQFLEKCPELKLTFDVSHWCNVHESLLEDQQEAVSLALERVEHIHARIGYEQAPQVNDPRAPEWKDAVQAHFDWWDKVAERKKKNGERMTVLTEFGPPDYMPTLPYTKQPLADQWAINVYMMQLIRKRYLS